MKRTYVDILGEYYDAQADAAADRIQNWITEADLRRIYKQNLTQKKVRFRSE